MSGGCRSSTCRPADEEEFAELMEAAQAAAFLDCNVDFLT